MNPGSSPRLSSVFTNMPDPSQIITRQPQSPFEIPRRSTPHPNHDTYYYEHSTTNSDTTIPDYETAWLCYRSYYIREERNIRNQAHYIWRNLTLQQQQMLLPDYGRIIDELCKESASKRGLQQMRRRGWAHIYIQPEHLHVTHLE